MTTPRYSRIDAPEVSQGEPDYFNRLSGFSNTLPDVSLDTATSPDYNVQRQSVTSPLSGTTRQDSMNSPEACLPPYQDYSDSPSAILEGTRMYNFHAILGYSTNAVRRSQRY
jgi:hypothetical protein